jgi:hypothetical protein
MDKLIRDQDTDEENNNEGAMMDMDESSQIEIIGQEFWNDFGDLLEDEDLT